MSDKYDGTHGQATLPLRKPFAETGHYDRRVTFSTPSSVSAARSPVPIYLFGFVVLGMSLSFGGPALAHLRNRSGVGIGESGLFLGGQAIGYIIASLAAGRSYDRGHGHRLWAGAAVVVAFAGIAIAFVHSFALVVGLFGLVGAGGAVMDVGGNTLVVWSQPSGRAGSTLNALHLLFGVGALTTPLLVSRSLLWGDNLVWFSVVLASAAMVLAVLLLTAPEPPHRATVHREAGSLPSHRRGLALVCVFFVLYVGLETGFAGWVHTYAEEIHLGGVGTAGLLTSVFWIGFTGGRLCAIWLARRVSMVGLLVWSCVAATAAVGAIAITGGSSPTVWVGTALFGATVGPQFPSMIAHSDERLGLSGSSTSLLIASAGVGGLVLPLGIGWLFDRRGAAAMPWTVTAASVATTIVVLVIVATVGQRPPVTSTKAPVT